MEWNNQPMTAKEAKEIGEGIFTGWGMTRYLSSPWSSQSWLKHALEHESARIAERLRGRGVYHSEAMAIGSLFEDMVQYPEMVPDWYFIADTYKVTTGPERKAVINAVYSHMEETNRDWPQVIKGADGDAIYRTGEPFKPPPGSGADVYDAISRFVKGATGKALATSGGILQCTAMISRCKKDDVGGLMFNAHAEHQITMAARLGQCMFRGRIDSMICVDDVEPWLVQKLSGENSLFYNKGIQVMIDYKTSCDVTPFGFRTNASKYGYVKQMVAYSMMYNRIMELQGKDKVDFAFVIAAVQRPKSEKDLLRYGDESIDSRIYVIDDNQWRKAAIELDTAINAHDHWFKSRADVLRRSYHLPVWA